MTNKIHALVMAQEVILDTLNRIEDSEYWWMDNPDKGGLDVEAMEEALEEIDRCRPEFPSYIHGTYDPGDRESRTGNWLKQAMNETDDDGSVILEQKGED